MEQGNLQEKLALFQDTWHPRIIAQVNDTQVKLVRLHGEFEWHHHEHEDELFLVLGVRLLMQFRDREVWLNVGDYLVVPHGVEHRPVAPEEVQVLLIEPAATLNTGNIRSERTRAALDRI